MALVTRVHVAGTATEVIWEGTIEDFETARHRIGQSPLRWTYGDRRYSLDQSAPVVLLEEGEEENIRTVEEAPQGAREGGTV